MNSWVRRTPTIEEEMKSLPLSIFCTMPCQSFGNRMALSIAYDYRGQEEMKTWWTWDLEENACSLNVFVRNRSPVLVHAIPWLWATNNESLINEKKVPRAIFLLRRFHPVVSERHIFFIISNTQIPHQPDQQTYVKCRWYSTLWTSKLFIPVARAFAMKNLCPGN